jgi:nifR3 family TIM-barrel protein
MSINLGGLEVWPPVVLAPMAGITDGPYRQLCHSYGGGLYVSEMVTTRALVERNADTIQMVQPAPGVTPRSVQLYGVDPFYVGEAVRYLVGEGLVDHIDLNFGCPVPKVTRKGGGAALPYKRPLLRAVLSAAVTAAGAVPVTMKTRKGIDSQHLTYLDAGRIAEDCGVAGIALHARTAEQHYSGQADWDAIASLKSHVSIPVLGNGDIWTAADALAMVSETGCDGVVVGRGCLGRPWLFADLDAAFNGRVVDTVVPLHVVRDVFRRHAALMADEYGEPKGCRELRKHAAWYLRGYPVGGSLRQELGMVSSLAELDDLLAQLDPDALPMPESTSTPRGRQGAPRRVTLPEGWLDDPDDETCVGCEDESEALAGAGGG